MLHDGIFKFQDFADAFEDKEVEIFLQKMPEMVTFHVHCAPVGEWVTTNYQTQKFYKLANVQLNPADSAVGVPGAAALLDFFEKTLKSLNVESEMLTSHIVGNIRFNRPTLYVFPSGQGDCSLFGVTGFTMLIDGGFTPLPCFWNFVRHLERLDSIMVTRLNESNLWGVSSFFRKKVLQPIYPHIGYIFCNITEGKASPTDEMHKDCNDLLVSVIDIGQKILGDMKNIGLSPHQCLREPCITPLTLYHKVGHGTLDMFILSPPRESRILRDFLQHWSTNKESFSFVRTGSASQSGQDIAIPISHVMSICCLLIWKPAEPTENITRMLFPGSAPQSRIFEGLEKIKHLDVLSYPVCSRSSLRPTVVGKPQPKSSTDAAYKSVPRFRSVSPMQRKIKSTKQASIESNKGDSSESLLSSPLHKKIQNTKSVPRKDTNVDKKSKIEEKTIKKSDKSASQKSPVKKAKAKTTIKSVKKTVDEKSTQKVEKMDDESKNNYVQKHDFDNKDIDSLEEEKKDSEKESPEPSPKKQLFQETCKDDSEEVLQITMTEETSIEMSEEASEDLKSDVHIAEDEKRDSEKGSEHASPKKSVLPEHLKDEMEPDSLESYDHDADGDISKDSLELSENDERRVSTERVDDIHRSSESSPTFNTCVAKDVQMSADEVDADLQRSSDVSDFSTSVIESKTEDDKMFTSTDKESETFEPIISHSVDDRKDSKTEFTEETEK
ncbi:Microtubule-associated protein futsch-like protein, partial [Leptotrombidium deliense]